MLRRLKNIFKRDKAIFHFKSERQSVDIYIHPNLNKNEKLHNSLVLQDYGYKISRECGIALFIRFLKYHGLWEIAIGYFNHNFDNICVRFGIQELFIYYIRLMNEMGEIFPYRIPPIEDRRKIYKAAIEWQKLMLSLNLIIK